MATSDHYRPDMDRVPEPPIASMLTCTITSGRNYLQSLTDPERIITRFAEGLREVDKIEWNFTGMPLDYITAVLLSGIRSSHRLGVLYRTGERWPVMIYGADGTCLWSVGRPLRYSEAKHIYTMPEQRLLTYIRFVVDPTSSQNRPLTNAIHRDNTFMIKVLSRLGTLTPLDDTYLTFTINI